MTIINFPRAKVSRVVHINRSDDPAHIIILPVVRIEQHPAEPKRPSQRQSRKLVMEKLRQLHLELASSL